MADSNVNPAISNESTHDGGSAKVDNELSLGDWHFISKSSDPAGSSDDESIVIIEREVASPISSVTSSDDSEIEEDNVDGANVLPVLRNRQIQTSEPASCEPCLQVISNTSRATDTQSISWRIIYSFTLGVLASLIIHQYKGYVYEKLLDSLCWNNEILSPVTYAGWSFPFFQSYSSSSEYDLHQSDHANDPVDELINQLHLDILRRKHMLDNTFSDQLDMLKNAKRLEDGVYVLNISELERKFPRRLAVSSDRKSILRVLTDRDEIPVCPVDVTNIKLPFLCQTSEDVSVLLEKSQLISMYENVDKFFQDSTSRFGRLHDDTVELLTQPDSYYEKNAKDANNNNMIPDCDNFSKHYKSDNYCLKTNSDCADSAAPSEEQAEPATLKFGESDDPQLSADSAEARLLWSKIAGKMTMNDGPDDTKSKNEKLSEELTIFLRKFKHDFENLYKMYMAVDEIGVTRPSTPEVSTVYVRGNSSAKNETTIDDEPDEVPNVAKTAETGPNIPESRPASGEWYFHLNDARSKLRKYYDEAMSINWLLKLGEARERLRKLRDTFAQNWSDSPSSTDEPKKKDWYQNAYEKLQHDFDKVTRKLSEMYAGKKEQEHDDDHASKKTREKVKDDHRKLSSLWRENAKIMTESLQNNFKLLQSSMKNHFKILKSAWKENAEKMKEGVQDNYEHIQSNFKNNFKTVSSTWKEKSKKMKESLRHNYEQLQSKFKDMFDYYF